jgi:hypothetical protein
MPLTRFSNTAQSPAIPQLYMSPNWNKQVHGHVKGLARPSLRPKWKELGRQNDDNEHYLRHLRYLPSR